MKPPVIDSLKDTQREIGGRWVIAKPLECFGVWRYIYRLQHAWHVLIGKASAVRFAEDA